MMVIMPPEKVDMNKKLDFLKNSAPSSNYTSYKMIEDVIYEAILDSIPQEDGKKISVYINLYDNGRKYDNFYHIAKEIDVALVKVRDKIEEVLEKVIDEFYSELRRQNENQ